MVKIFLFLFFFATLSRGEIIRVFAAADLQYALGEIAELYKNGNPRDRVELVFGSSGKGAIKIRAGAPYHLFFSADMGYVEDLHRQGHIITRPKPYAVGRIVVWVRKDSGLDPSNFPHVLFDRMVKRIALANWKHAPYGKAAKQALESYGAFEKLKGRFVLGENIAQTASYVYSGSAEVGIIALSIALAPAMKEVGAFWIIPQDRHEPIVQGYGITKAGKDSQGARRLYEFLQTPKAREILTKHGFSSPEVVR